MIKAWRNMYIDKSRINIELIVNELYDFSKIGALSIPNILLEKASEDLVNGAKSAKKFFWRPPKKEGPVIQEMESLYIEELNEECLDKKFKNSINKFRKEYIEIYKEIAEKAGFQENFFNSIGIHYYQDTSIGITPHRDYAKDKDLISIFVLQGQARFCVCKDRNGSNYIELDSSPRSLILLRAARKNSEQKYRPFHYLESIKQERFSLIVRRRQEKNFNERYKKPDLFNIT